MADTGSAEGARDHVLPGGHVFEGVTYGQHVTDENLERVKKTFEFMDDDIVLVTYPKSGTHWMRTIIELVLKRKEESQSSNEGHPTKVTFMEFNMPPHFKVPCMDFIEKNASPRFYMSHLGVDFFTKPLQNKKTKFIVVMRNIKDTLVSYYHFYRSNIGLGQFKGTFADFIELFKEKKIVYGDWFDYTLGWWEQRDHPNCTFFMYEDMKRDPVKEIERVGEILGVPLSPEDVSNIREESSFDAMKKTMDRPPSGAPDTFKAPTDNKISPFMRKGQVGDWTNHLTPEVNEYLDKVYEERMAGLDVKPNFVTKLS